MALLPDLDTRSVLNVVEENFQRLGLRTYAIRMVYVGEHTLPKDELIFHFKKSIFDVNSGYCDIRVVGLLLVYDSYFVHVIEGSEDTIHRQLRFIFQREIDWIEQCKVDEIAAALALEDFLETQVGLPKVDLDLETRAYLEEALHKAKHKERIMFRRLKMLMVYNSISRLMFDKWRATTAKPPSLVGKLDLYAPLHDHMEQLRICLLKVYKVCDFAQADEHLSFEGLSAVDPKIEALPEVTLLDYLLHSPHVLDLRHTAHLHRRVDDYHFYFENVWPLPNHFTPRFLYKLKIDDSFVERLPVMPWELIKPEAAEDEEREERSDSSSD